MENFQLFATILLGIIFVGGLIGMGIAIFSEPKLKQKA